MENDINGGAPYCLNPASQGPNGTRKHVAYELDTQPAPLEAPLHGQMRTI